MLQFLRTCICGRRISWTECVFFKIEEKKSEVDNRYPVRSLSNPFGTRKVLSLGEWLRALSLS